MDAGISADAQSHQVLLSTVLPVAGADSRAALGAGAARHGGLGHAAVQSGAPRCDRTRDAGRTAGDDPHRPRGLSAAFLDRGEAGAVLHLRQRSCAGAGAWCGARAIACLPDVGDDPQSAVLRPHRRATARRHRGAGPRCCAAGRVHDVRRRGFLGDAHHREAARRKRAGRAADRRLREERAPRNLASLAGAARADARPRLHVRRRASHAALGFFHRQAGPGEHQLGAGDGPSGDRRVQRLDDASGALQCRVGRGARLRHRDSQLPSRDRRGRQVDARSSPPAGIRHARQSVRESSRVRDSGHPRTHSLPNGLKALPAGVSTRDVLASCHSLHHRESLMRVRACGRIGTAALAVIVSAGCTVRGGSSTSPPTVALAMRSGDPQNATVAHAVATAPSVMVTSNGQAKAGATVTFAVASGSGSVTGATATTDATGMAHAGSWTLGNTAGTNTLTASVSGAAPVTFTATGIAGPVAAITKIAGDNLTATAGATLGTAPSVSLADQFGNLVSSQTVTFAVASGGGSVTGATPSSGANGIATVGGWTLGAAAGSNTLTASSGSAPAATFTATGTAPITLPSLGGTWHGTWVDTRYGVSGAITSVVLTQTATTFAGTGTIDLSSLGLGVQNGTAAGTIAGNVITFTFTAAGIGSGNGSLNGPAGSGTGGGTALNFGNFTFTGTASATQITGPFQFTSQIGGNGTITVTKP